MAPVVIRDSGFPLGEVAAERRGGKVREPQARLIGSPRLAEREIAKHRFAIPQTSRHPGVRAA
ncbi:hypothetical protein Abr02nite_79080 [Paractinoplanes brasiliensis]|nr:hypothetical protein Abr02nite_79080 [Actinoplanes brasiliensis]